MNAKVILGYVALTIIFGVGTYVKFKINERRFRRRNIAGIEEFTSYGRAVVVQSTEGFIYRVAGVGQGVAIALAVIGAFFIHGHP